MYALAYHVDASMGATSERFLCAVVCTLCALWRRPCCCCEGVWTGRGRGAAPTPTAQTLTVDPSKGSN